MALRVLVVDDEDSVRRLAVRILGGRGYEVLETSRGLEALELVRERKVDVLISNVRMPDMTGPEVVQRAWELDESLPVVFITAYAYEQIPSEMLGRVAVVTKPFAVAALINAVEEAARRRSGS